MWLLNTVTGSFVPTGSSLRPRYAILSHVWAPSGEQTFQELRLLDPSTGLRDASVKIQNCCKFAHALGYSRVWIDNCCIDKASSAELSEAINSMYLWYAEASVCLVFLEDVSDDDDPRSPYSQFCRSKWFTRGWTLQELVAPKEVLFLSRGWRLLGTKSDLAEIIEQVTKIPLSILLHTQPLSAFSVAQRMSWASGRETTRLEDEAYALMGIFDIHMPTLYGEGRRAFIRLQEEILMLNPTTEYLERSQLLLTDSPREFYPSSAITSAPMASVAHDLGPHLDFVPEILFTSYGARVRMLLIPFKLGSSLVTHVAVLSCRNVEGDALVLLLRPQDGEPVANRFFVGNRRFLQHIRLTTLHGVRDLGALVGPPVIREIYIPYVYSSYPLVNPLVVPETNTVPARSHLSCPCRVVLPAGVIEHLNNNGYAVMWNSTRAYTNECIEVTSHTDYSASHGVLEPSDFDSITLQHNDYDLQIVLFPARGTHWRSASLNACVVGACYEGCVLTKGAFTVESWDGFSKGFRVGALSVQLTFTPCMNDLYVLDIRVASLNV
ncbi:heterokaryon incompatibility protein-domain-containing protein [Trametes meyenii]|nr:heterokaryon incompatibility protein-domain-containing protein [Trametes meyenii]